jgi:peptidoglycan/xylan/chitin deacetylase (PgdA/CDA1 family)
MKVVRAARAGRWKLALHLVAFAIGGAAAHTWPSFDGAEPFRAAAELWRPLRQAAGLESARGPKHQAKPAVAPRDQPGRVSADHPAPAEPIAEDLTAVIADPTAEPFELAAGAKEHGPDPLGERFGDGLIITGSTPHRLILFTFDDGPDPRTTPLLLDRLDEAGVKAVFFLVASRMTGATPIERHQAAIAREIGRRGHLIGGHTLDHVQLPLLDDEQVEHQLDESERIFQQALGGVPRLFRPPFGAHSERVDQHLVAHHYTPVLWNLGAGDFQVRTTDEVFDIWLKVLERRERENGDRGGIVLLHDTYAWSVDAFERIYAYLQAQNCLLLERGEELYDVVDDLEYFYVPRNGADEEVEAPRAEPPEEVLAARQAVLRERTARRCKSLASAF